MPSPFLLSWVKRAAAAARRLPAGVGTAGAMSAAAAATPRRSRLTAITEASPQGSNCWTQEFLHPTPEAPPPTPAPEEYEGMWVKPSLSRSSRGKKRYRNGTHNGAPSPCW